MDINKSAKILLESILIEIADIKSFVGDLSEADFFADVKRKKATTMSLINIGEIANIFSKHSKDDLGLPLSNMMAMRNVVAHGYFTIRNERVWYTLKNSIPELEIKIRKIINDASGKN